MAHVVVAPDSFKGSLGAAAVAAALAEGWRTERPDDTLTLLPQADGGEGTLDALAAAIPESSWSAPVDVTGPDGRPAQARWLRLPDRVAVVELAATSGLPMMDALDALGASTRGLGDLIEAILADRTEPVERLVIGLGGSASTDGGAGALRALGAHARGLDGAELAEGGGALLGLTVLDLSGLRRPPAGGVELLSDVTAPLLGASGAAVVFGPQKGADLHDIDVLDAALGRWAQMLGEATGRRDQADTPGAGAAGGTGFGFITAWGATVSSGAARVASLTGLTAALPSADLLVTGEGRFDATSLTGKVVGHGLSAAADAGVPVAVVAGALGSEPQRHYAGASGLSLVDVSGSESAAMAHAAHWLRVAGAEAARRFGGSAS